MLDVADVYTFTQPGGLKKQFADGRLNDLQRTKQVARIPPTGGISSISFNVGGLINWPHGLTPTHVYTYTVVGETGQEATVSCAYTWCPPPLVMST